MVYGEVIFSTIDHDKESMRASSAAGKAGSQPGVAPYFQDVN